MVLAVHLASHIYIHCAHVPYGTVPFTSDFLPEKWLSSRLQVSQTPPNRLANFIYVINYLLHLTHRLDDVLPV